MTETIIGPGGTPPPAADESAAPAHESQQIVANRYQLLEQLAEGGMGVVWRARHLMMGKEFALKRLRPEIGATEEHLRRFEREAQAASMLNHPHCISVTDFGRESDGSFFLVMELLRGHSLASLLETHPRLTWARAANLARQVLEALSHAHARGVVHRDLKPENVFLVEQDDGADYVKIVDFGIAKIASPHESDAVLTQAGFVFGTPEYISPEQAAGEGADARADLYALGVIFYEMLAGRRPFESDSKVELVSMHLTRPVPSLGDAAPPAFAALIMRALSKRREDRFADANEFLRGLDDAVADPGRVPALRRPSNWRGLGALLVVLLVVVVALAMARRMRAKDSVASLPATMISRCAAVRDLYAAKRHAEALDSHRAALHDCFGDEVLLASAEALVPDKTLGERALAVLADSGEPAIPALARLATSKNPARRQAAVAALQSLNAGDRYDRVVSLSLDLQQLPTCIRRREALRKLVAMGDARALPEIRKALEKRAGFLGFDTPNQCLEKEARAAIKSLGG